MKLKSIAVIVSVLALAVCLWGCGEQSADENNVIKAKSGISKTEIGRRTDCVRHPQRQRRRFLLFRL